MRKQPISSLLRRSAAAFDWLMNLDIPIYAAHAGYFIVLSVFPALLLVLSGLRYTGLEVNHLIRLLSALLPQALMGTAEKLIYNIYANASATVAGLSALTAIWSASRGIYGLVVGLNAIYGVSENRGYFYTRAISVVYTVLLAAVLLMTLVLHVFGNALLELLLGLGIPGVETVAGLLNLRFFLLLAVQSLLFTAMYMFLPNRRNRFVESLPGGLLASIGWLVFSNLYSVYVTHFPRYANIYGSVYAIAISMLWLHFCMSIIFLGGAVNRLLCTRAEE